jgi:hypothetical protein
MPKLTILLFFIFCTPILHAQNDILVLKKGDRTVQYFYKDSYISFQLNNKEWMKGIINKIENDSFYFTKVMVRYYTLGSDTTYEGGYHFAVTDIFSLPKKGVQIDFTDERFSITRNGGHQHWYWIKSGWLFRALGIGYATLNVVNGIIDKDFTHLGSKLGIAAGAVLVGVVLKHSYQLTHRRSKKYHLETIKVSGNNPVLQ